MNEPEPKTKFRQTPIGMLLRIIIAIWSFCIICNWCNQLIGWLKAKPEPMRTQRGIYFAPSSGRSCCNGYHGSNGSDGSNAFGFGSSVRLMPVSGSSENLTEDYRDDYEVADDDPEITFDDYDDDEGDEDYD